MTTYRAWFRRDNKTTAPVKADVIYSGKPNGNLVGELPAGSRPKAPGKCGTLDRSDGGDPYERALFETPSGRTVVVEREAPARKIPRRSAKRDRALEHEALREMGIDPLAGEDIGCK